MDNNANINQEESKKYYLIQNWRLKELDEKDFNKKEYYDDYLLSTVDEKLKIIDLDKRNIRPYAMELLNSMSNLSFTFYSKWSFYTWVLIIGICFLLMFRSNWSDDIIKKIDEYKNICTQEKSIDSVSDVYSWINTSETTPTPIRKNNLPAKNQ